MKSFVGLNTISLHRRLLVLWSSETIMSEIYLLWHRFDEDHQLHHAAVVHRLITLDTGPLAFAQVTVKLVSKVSGHFLHPSGNSWM